MKQYINIHFFLITCIVLIIPVISIADTIKVSNGSVLVGKIINETKDTIIFSNSYGTFKIKKQHLVETFKTESYQEDIQIYKKLNLKIYEAEIKRNYLAGLEKKEKSKEEDKTQKIEPVKSEGYTSRPLWTSGRISFSGSCIYINGQAGSSIYINGKDWPVVPHGYAGHVAFDQGLDGIIKKRNMAWPGLRLEGGYLYIPAQNYSTTGFTAAGGLMWTFPSMKNHGGCFVFALMPGAAYIEMKAGGLYNNVTGHSYKFIGQAIAGYQVSFGVFSMFLHARYLYIHDPNKSFHSIGGEFGFGFNLW